MTNEYVVDHSTSKWCKLSRSSFAVGALARVNNNYHLLHPEAVKVAEMFGLKPINFNPYMNNIAQLVECVHCTYEIVGMIEELAGLEGAITTKSAVKPVAGIGVGAVEVPRGILYHEYEYNSEGRVVKANCIIPTTQNNANIYEDIGELAKKFAVKGMTDAKLELLCSMLVRAYDPCISCSVH
jgi:coenzyme F420-reducing hydrogenase alpha subunit